MKKLITLCASLLLILSSASGIAHAQNTGGFKEWAPHEDPDPEGERYRSRYPLLRHLAHFDIETM